MEDWRIYALAFFPKLRIELLDEGFSYYHVFFDLHSKLTAAYRNSDSSEDLRHRFAFARWCLLHDDEDISNAAIVAFYEHLFDHRENWDYAIDWVYDDKEIIRRCWPIWEYRARNRPPEVQDLRELLDMDRFDAKDAP
jgi:hypothetical protein